MKALFLMFAFADLVIAALFSRETVRAWRYDLGYGEEERKFSISNPGRNSGIFFALRARNKTAQ